MDEKRMIDDRLAAMISGGKLEDGWEDIIDEVYEHFMRADEEEMNRYGHRKDLDGFLYFIKGVCGYMDTEEINADYAIIRKYASRYFQDQ